MGEIDKQRDIQNYAVNVLILGSLKIIEISEELKSIPDWRL